MFAVNMFCLSLRRIINYVNATPAGRFIDNYRSQDILSVTFIKICIILPVEKCDMIINIHHIFEITLAYILLTGCLTGMCYVGNPMLILLLVDIMFPVVFRVKVPI